MTTPRLAGAIALLTAASLGCSDAQPPVAAASSDATEFNCTATGAAVGQPRVYFSPFDPVEQEALCVLDQAQSEVVVAHYNIRRESYLDKLVELASEGVDVKVVVDQANAAKDYNVGDDFMEENGIDLVRIKPSGSGSLMHLKVTVVDRSWVMTGSFNWNGTASLANDENMIVLRDPELVEHYRDQVLEVRGDLPHRVQGGEITESASLHFAPEERLDNVLVEHIGKATETIDVAMFTFTKSDVADALVKAARDRQVTVRVVMENKQCGSTTVDETLEPHTLLLRGANKIGAYSAMHQKYAIIDGYKVITGATNWTYKGTRKNDEDMLILEDAELAAAYQQNFADLLHVYGGVADDSAPSRAEAPVLFNALYEDTEWGDRLVVTGNHPSLGSWNPYEGVELLTSTSLFPSWTGRGLLPAGSQLEYKYVRIRPSGSVHWEPGQNRVLDLPDSGRATVISGNYGDTSDSWTPQP